MVRLVGTGYEVSCSVESWFHWPKPILIFFLFISVAIEIEVLSYYSSKYYRKRGYVKLEHCYTICTYFSSKVTCN